jgi:putative methionine-R-sulfoxide reductase with GAF domain
MERYSIVGPSAPTQADGSKPAPMPWPSETAPMVETSKGVHEDTQQSPIKVATSLVQSSGPDSPSPTLQFPGEDGGKSLAEMAQRDLDATLRLLAERAQYITEATGAAIALCEDDEMVCRASAGSSAPEMGANLQVDSGLTGESVHSRKILHCEDAETDPRVNRESCQALGIASVVVMPLLREQEVSGLFELFSDKPHAFTQRDIAALERLGEMVQVALDHAEAARAVPETLTPSAEKQTGPAPSVAGDSRVSAEAKATPASSGSAATSVPANIPTTVPAAAKKADAQEGVKAVAKSASAQAAPILPSIPKKPEIPRKVEAERPATAASDPYGELKASLFETPPPKGPAQPAVAAKVGTAEVATIRKCEKCGFPISVGRTLCLDCEPKTAVPIGAASVPDRSPAAAATNKPAKPSAADAKQNEEKSFLRNPYVIGALVLLIMLAIAFWLSHSS